MNIFAILNESELHISRVLNTVVLVKLLTNKYAMWLIRVISVILGPPLDHCYTLVTFSIEQLVRSSIFLYYLIQLVETAVAQEKANEMSKGEDHRRVVNTHQM